MRDETIRVGDLVQVVRWPCCGLNLGKIGTVSNIDYERNIYCCGCGSRDFPMPNADFPKLRKGALGSVPIAYLKKIHPPSLDESTETKEEIAA